MLLVTVREEPLEIEGENMIAPPNPHPLSSPRLPLPPAWLPVKVLSLTVAVAGPPEDSTAIAPPLPWPLKLPVPPLPPAVLPSNVVPVTVSVPGEPKEIPPPWPCPFPNALPSPPAPFVRKVVFVTVSVVGAVPLTPTTPAPVAPEAPIMLCVNTSPDSVRCGACVATAPGPAVDPPVNVTPAMVTSAALGAIEKSPTVGDSCSTTVAAAPAGPTIRMALVTTTALRPSV